MLKKETVNLILKNANLCLGFALVHFILTNHFAAKAFSLATVTRFLRGEREKWGGPQGPRPLLCNL